MLANLQPSQGWSWEIPENQESSDLEREWAWESAEAATSPRIPLGKQDLFLRRLSQGFDEDRTLATGLLQRVDK